jgi:hypothetical protein
MQRVATSALAFGLLTACALGQSTPEPSGSIQGAVFTTEQDYARSVVPGTKLSLDGALHLEAEGDSEGTFVFSAVPVGSYTITAQAPGLTATTSQPCSGFRFVSASIPVRIRNICRGLACRSRQQ